MAPLPGSGITVCTEPLPKLREPTSTARRRSCNAPATISLDDAEPLLISTTIGAPPRISAPLAFNHWESSAWCARMDTFPPRPTNRLKPPRPDRLGRLGYCAGRERVPSACHLPAAGAIGRLVLAPHPP